MAEEQDQEITAEQAADLQALQAEAERVQGQAPEIVRNAPDVPDSIPTVEIVGPVVAMACAAFVPAWEVSGPEQEQLSGVYAAVLDKYFPRGMTMGPELTALLVTAAIVMPRLGRPRKIEEKGGGSGE